LTKELELRGFSWLSQKAVVITYKGFTREEPLQFDMLVEGLRVGRGESRGEDSAHPQGTTPELHESCWNVPIGLLINFHEMKLTRQSAPADPAGAGPMKPD